LRALVLHRPGQSPEVGEHPDPVDTVGHSVVRVSAAPVVPLDLLCASGTSYFGTPAVPYVPGVQGVGTVEQSALHPAGTRVWFATSAGMAPGDGALAERCLVKDSDLVAIGSEPSDTDVAALGTSAIAAWMCLTWKARLQAGETVLALGAGGAVGQSVIGAAKVLGAGRVVAVCRPGPSTERAHAAGADEVVAVHDDPEVLTSLLTSQVGTTVDVVIDPVGGAAATAALRVLGPGGRLVNLGGSMADTATYSSAGLRSRSLEILGYTNNALTGEQRGDAFTAVLGHAAGGRIRVTHEAWPLELGAEAWARQASGDAAGRLVLLP
jgi:NADPH:quinone reductase-like Zn-dependent oxidoreductase